MENKERKMTTALHLCYWLGGIGAHRFYTGYIGIGILYLLTCGGFGIGALVDFINICRNKYTDKDGNLLANYSPKLVKIYLSIIGFIVFIAILNCCFSS